MVIGACVGKPEEDVLGCVSNDESSTTTTESQATTTTTATTSTRPPTTTTTTFKPPTTTTTTVRPPTTTTSTVMPPTTTDSVSQNPLQLTVTCPTNQWREGSDLVFQGRVVIDVNQDLTGGWTMVLRFSSQVHSLRPYSHVSVIEETHSGTESQYRLQVRGEVIRKIF